MNIYQINSFRCKGFTLIELMVTLMVLAIISSFAAPSYFNMVNSGRQSSELRKFVGGAMMARSEAVKRGARSVICASSDGATCDTSANWDDGWIVFIDENANDTKDSGEVLVRVNPAMRTGLSLTGSTSVSKQIRYQSNGTSLEAGTLTLCDPRGVEKAGAIVIGASGKPRKSKTALGGGALSC